MRGTRLIGGLALGLMLLDVSGAQDEAEAPRESGLVERSGRRLVQLDVTVDGPKDQIRGLGRGDFRLSVGGRKIQRFTVDDLCTIDQGASPAAPAAPAEPEASAAPVPQPVPRPRTTYLFYFDQQNLNPPGRIRALELARELIPQLIVDGARATVVSYGRELGVFAELSDDPAALLEAVDEVGRDRMQWDPQVMLHNEVSNYGEIQAYLDNGELESAAVRAKQLQREEAWKTGRTLRMFSLVLGRLADVEPPKVVIYFADTMRSNAGAHYLSLFSARQAEAETGTGVALWQADLGAFRAEETFERVVEEAATNGVRLYTIQAEGLVGDTMELAPNRSFGQARPATLNQQRVRDAQDSLTGLALETGGEAFLNGVRAAKVADAIREDLSCLYLISFDAEGLPEDESLPVTLHVDRKKVRLQTRGRVIVQSEQRRLESRLLAAFATPATTESDVPLGAVLIPTGFDKGRYTALVQVSVPASPVAASTWDLGFSLVARGKVREDAAGRVTLEGPGARVVFEGQASFAPGPYELITVAHETTTNAVSSARVEGSWPDPDDAPATLGPIAVIQPTAGVFLRDSALRRSGSWGLGEHDIAHTDRPTAMVGIVCRGPGGPRRPRLERRLVGDSQAEFAPTEPDLGDERCALFSDLVPENTMTSGEFVYEVRVLGTGEGEEGEEALAVATRSLIAASPDELPSVAGLAGR